MNDKPRYSRVSDMIDLAIYMASKTQGITVQDIMEYYNVSRRTAERMRDSLTCIFPEIEEIETPDKRKHWGFTSGRITALIHFKPKEIANLEQLQRRTTNRELKTELNETITKMKAIASRNKNSLQNNIELFMQTEGYAIRQMPQYRIEIKILETIRTALQHSKIVTGKYHNKQRFLEPLGLIYGEKIYLIAREKAKGDGIYNYLLHKFSDLKLTDTSFDKGDFNLQKYSEESFGVYHGKILNVTLSFSPKLANEASHFNFHPTQKIKAEKDGTLTVKFRASGNKEIIWHVFRWGEGCKIISPKSLKEEYKKYLQNCLSEQ